MNYQITFDPDGGDMGRASLTHINPFEFQMILPHIAHILECLYLSNLFPLSFKYAFEFSAHYNNEILLIMNTIKLPPHVKFYECDGRKIFEMRGASGGLVSSYICYLITGE